MRFCKHPRLAAPAHLWTALCVVALGFASGPAAALSLTFRHVISGGTGLQFPAIDGDKVAFGNQINVGTWGVFVETTGGIQAVANTSQISGLFVAPVEFGGGVVVFNAGDTGGARAVYQGTAGSFSLVADTSTSIPEFGGGTFIRVGAPSIDGGTIAFWGQGASSGTSGHAVVRFDSGALSTVVADQSVYGLNQLVSVDATVPGVAWGGSPDSDGLRITDPDGSAVAWFLWPCAPGQPPPACGGTPIPEGSTEFGGISSLMGDPVAREDGVAFLGSGPNGVDGGLYLDHGGDLVKVIKFGEALPDGGGILASIFEDRMSVFGDTVVFQAFNQGDTMRGVFIFRNGQLDTILNTGDFLDGKEVSQVFVGRDAIDGDNVALHVTFTTGERAIYVATIPEPSTMLLLIVGLAGLAAAGRRSRP